MDKNEYNLKLQEIDRLVDQGNYTQAAAVADQIDWKRVRNVRTLCLISEIYEKEGRYEDSKALLVRAYRRSPVGRAILYRLVEVTIKLKQFDEAVDYYSAYVQAAPNDTSRYILKYKIYRGRGSSVDEQIEILKEYLDQEYNEKYAYELAKLYQEADRIQECLATCDDLVLWFHSGKYVIKALELKQKYASLTPKQQEIYNHRFDEEDDTPELGQEKQIVTETPQTGEAEVILEDTSKAIADEVAKAADPEGIAAPVEEGGTRLYVPDAGVSASVAAAAAGTVLKEEAEQLKEDISRQLSGEAGIADEDLPKQEDQQEEIKLQEQVELPEQEDTQDHEEEAVFEEETVSEEEAVSEEETDGQPDLASLETPAKSTEEDLGQTRIYSGLEEIKAELDQSATQEIRRLAQQGETGEDLDEPITDAETFDEQLNKYNTQELQTEMIKSMREIVSGVGLRDLVDEDKEAEDRLIEESKQIQADSGVNMTRRLTMPELERKRDAGQLSIDDILLSMGDRGNAVRQAAAKVTPATKPQPAGVLSAVDEALLNMGISPQKEPAPERPLDELFRQPVPEDAAKDIPAEEISEAAQAAADAVSEEFTAAEEAAVYEAPLDEAPLNEVPLDEAPLDEAPLDEAALDEVLPGAEEAADTAASLVTEESGILPESVASLPEGDVLPEDGNGEAEDDIRIAPEPAHKEMPKEMEGMQGTTEELAEALVRQEDTLTGDVKQDMTMDEIIGAKTRRIPTEEISQRRGQESVSGEEAASEESGEAPGKENEEAPENREVPVMYLKPELRPYFEGYLGVRDMEKQIYDAITQAMAKGADRTSRTGNILIFGGHGCGKTTIATGLAKAIAQERGDESVKMARIYATDLNRKDIAATVAKIAGGILIVEEAGDLEDGIADQLTTAMEFRTDGLIVILEDEQRYMHDLLMRHPRMTMKFTSQIYIPGFTTEDLIGFGRLYADDRDYAINEEATQALRSKLDGMSAAAEMPLSITAVLDLVDQAILRANKFGRKLFSGKKRYDEEGRIILTVKDFR